MIDQIKTRAAGLVLLLLLLVPACAGLVLLPILILVGPLSWARSGLLALDLFGNATVLQGSPYESISSHTGRGVFMGRTWAIWLAKFLDLFQPGHAIGAMAEEAKLQKAIRAALNNGS